MFDRDDNIYSNGGGFVSSTFHLGLYGLGAAAGISLISDPSSFRKAATNLLDKVAPTTKPTLNAYNSSVETIRTMAVNASKHRASFRSKISDSLKSESFVERMPNGPLNPIDTSAFKIKHSAAYPTTRESFSYSDWSQVKDGLGNDVGTTVFKKLQELDAKHGIGFKLNDAKWSGTTVTVETGSGAKIYIPFAKKTDDGEWIIRRGNASNSASMTYKHVLGETGLPTGNIELMDFNQTVSELISNERMVKDMASADVSVSSLLNHISDSGLGTLSKVLERNEHAKQAAQQLESAGYAQQLKRALKILTSNSQFVSPGDTIGKTVNAGLVAPHIHQQMTMAEAPATKNFGSEFLAATAMSPIGSSSSREKGNLIKQSYQALYGVNPENVSYGGRPITSSKDSYVQQLVSDIRQSGINQSVSSGQIPYRMGNIGGIYTGPAVVEGYKTLSTNSFVKNVSSNGSLIDAWRYQSRYATSSKGTRASKLIGQINENRGVFTMYGAIDFLGDEQVRVAKRMTNKIKHTSNIQTSIQGYTQEQGEQSIFIHNINHPEDVREFQLADLYNSTTESGQSLHSLMHSGNYEIRGGKRFNFGAKNLTRPISGADDDLGIDVLSGNVYAKQKWSIGKREYDSYLEMDKLKVAEMTRDGYSLEEIAARKVSIPLQMETHTTKLGLAGQLARGSVSVGNFKNDFEFTLGADLFKHVLPSAAGGEFLSVGKQQAEMLPFMHSMLFGNVHAAALQNRQVILKGKRAKQFQAFASSNIMKNGEVNLNDFLFGGHSLVIDPRNQEQYANQLKFMADLTADVRTSRLSANAGFITIGNERIAEENYLTKAWNASKEFFDTHNKNGTMPSVTPEEHRWQLSQQFTALEGSELSQGSHGFNTARFSMRDQFMYIGTNRNNILEEMLSRSATNTVGLVKERELLHSSIYNQNTMLDRVNEYTDYIRQIHGDEVADEYMKQYTLFKKGDIEGMKANMAKYNTGANIHDAREYPEYIADSLLSKEKNVAGKLVVGENGQLIHLPSHDAMRGLTLLENGKVTFEGAEGTNVKEFWNVAQDATLNGQVARTTIHKNQNAFYKLGQIINKESGAINIHDASYARNIYETHITHHPVMEHLNKGTLGTELSDASRATFGNLATIGQQEAQLMIQHEINMAAHNMKSSTHSKTLADSLNELKSHWLAQDHKHIIEDVQSVIASHGVGSAEYVASMQKGTRRIVAERMRKSDELYKRLNRLEEARRSGDIKGLTTLTEELESFINKHSTIISAERDPYIFSGSESYLHGFIVPRAWQPHSKTMSVGFSAALNMAADQDGDKIKYFMLHSREARQEALSAITGVQLKSEKYMNETKARMKMMAGKNGHQVLDVTSGQTKNIAKFIYETQGEASVYAHYMTKAFTGTMNIAALNAKGASEKALQNTKLSQEQIENVAAWTRSIPSLVTEQQVISSKHLSSIIGDNLKSTTNIQEIMNNIGKISSDDMLKVLQETDQVHPLMLMSMSHILDKPADKAAYAKAKQIMDLKTDIQTGMNRVTEAQLEEYKEYLQVGRSEEEWTQYVKDIMSRQEKFTPLAEREEFKAIGFGNNRHLSDIIHDSKIIQKDKIDTVLQSVVEHLKDSGKSVHSAAPEEVHELIGHFLSKTFAAADELYGSTLASSLPKASRRVKGWDKIAEKAGSFGGWVKEAPLERLGGLAMVGMGISAMFNVLTGSSINSERDIPSLNNPGMEGHGNSYSSGGTISGNNFRNTSYSLLSSGSMPHSEAIHSINNITGNQGYHSVSVRSDTTNPYLDKMSYYN